MSERFATTGEMAGSREAACAVGGVAVANCVECPASLSCPILQLKQRSEEVVLPVKEQQRVDNWYDNDGGGTSVIKQPVAPVVTPNIPPRTKDKEYAAAKQAEIEKAARARMNQSATIHKGGPTNHRLSEPILSC